MFYPSQPTYNPQFEPGKAYTCKQGGHGSNYNGPSKDVNITVNTGYRYPKTILRVNRDRPQLHPTQKPVALWEYLIRTYTNPGDTVLDNCCGSGTTGVACQNTGRNFIQMELDPRYVEITNRRLEENAKRLGLPLSVDGDEFSCRLDVCDDEELVENSLLDFRGGSNVLCDVRE